MKKLGYIKTGFMLVFTLCLAFPLPARAQIADEEAALIHYYVQAARENYERLDMRRDGRPFELLLLTRRFMLDSNADTLQLDTALIRASYHLRGDDQSSADTLLPDTIEVFKSSFLEEEPGLPALFFPPPWQEELIYSLYPNDPGIGDIALGFRVKSPPGTASLAGLFLVDRSSGRLTYLLRNGLDENGNSRSAEYVFIEKDGALIPQKVVEHITRSPSSAGYYIIETHLLSAHFH